MTIIIIAIIVTVSFCYFVLFNRELHMHIFRSWNPKGYETIKSYEEEKREPKRETFDIVSFSVKTFDHYYDYNRALGPFEVLAGTKQEVLQQLLSGMQPYKGLDVHSKVLFKSQKARIYKEISALDDHQYVIVFAER